MSPLANQDPLAQLNDIIAPTAPHWFPPAPIYWALLLLTIAVVFIVLYLIKKQRKQQKIKKEQLTKLLQLQQSKVDFVALNQLLKGCALHYFSRSEVASLHGKQWFNFLQKHSDVVIFKNEQDFMQRLYSSKVSPCLESDFSEAKKWISALPKQIKKGKKDV